MSKRVRRMKTTKTGGVRYIVERTLGPLKDDEPYYAKDSYGRKYQLIVYIFNFKKCSLK